jgi:CBS domain-containing protein
MSSEVLVVAPEDTLGEIAERMREHDVGSALVSDFGRLIGILTARDLLGAFAGRVHSSEARAREWMTSEPISVVATTPLAAALQLMTDHAIHHLPVVEGDRPVGMVGARQLARAVAELARHARASASVFDKVGWASQSRSEVTSGLILEHAAELAPPSARRAPRVDPSCSPSP